MPEIDLDTHPTPPPAMSRRARLVAILTAPAPTVLVVAIALVVAALVRMPDPRPTAPTVTSLHAIRAGVSAFPARASAQWRDAAGQLHELPLDPDQPVRVPAVEAIVVVATDGVQCTLMVDGTTVDFATATAGGVALCSWKATVTSSGG